MATSANGFIAKSNHDTPWSKEEFLSYSDMVKKVGNLFVGKTTFDLMSEENAFAELGNPKVVVLTHNELVQNNENTFYVHSFSDGVRLLKKLGFTEILIGGGSFIDSEALESGKLDEIFIDIEPCIFGNGIPLFKKSEVTVELDLVSTKRIGKSGVQVHYKLLK